MPAAVSNALQRALRDGMRESQMETLENAVPASAFASLPETPIRWSTFALGFLVPTALVVFFATTGISFMAPVLEPVDTRESVHLVAPVLEPVPEEPKPVAEIKAPAPKPIVPPKVQAKAPVITPPPEVPKVEVAKVTPPVVTPAKPDRMPEFASKGSSAPVTLQKPPRQVQTGGFGDPNGVPANNNSTSKGPLIAKVGSFDLPSGPGLW